MSITTASKPVRYIQLPTFTSLQELFTHALVSTSHLTVLIHFFTLTRCLDETGSPSAKRGIFLCYDVFGLYIQALRGADILASGYSQTPDDAGEFKVFMPDFWGDHPQDMANFPPKTPKQFKAIMDFMTGPAAPDKTLPLMAPLLDEMKRRNPGIESWAIMGFCWGGKITALMSQEGTPYKAAAQCHPSLLDVEDAKLVTIPMVVLPSMDEDPAVSIPSSRREYSLDSA